MAQVEFRSWDGSEEGKESATLAHFRDQMFSRWPELGLTWATVCVMAGYTLVSLDWSFIADVQQKTKP